jgi:hypothetical protein
MPGKRSVAPHLLCHRPGPHTVCIVNRPLGRTLLPTTDTRICGTAERLQFRVYLKLGALGERLRCRH